ncbi:surfactin synthase thioesterase subunit [Kineosporia succinea]|uniref:Surfactin synthase thioesterase subunit n=2 Tax=Kineosporia succinea TaxID=84632 RepID=A0ABT9P6U2_9ACTN|nr:surfactin synthase thioesterase subunit [Kineosporia succinea]
MAFDAVTRLQSADGPLPAWIGVSAHPGPHHSITRDAPPLYSLPAGELRRALHRMGGLPARVLEDHLLWRRVEPIVRADLQAAETWRPATSPAVLRCALAAYCGSDDPIADPSQAANWARHTERFAGVQAFPGGHFYFQDAPDRPGQPEEPSVVERLVASIVDHVGRARVVPGSTAHGGDLTVTATRGSA